MNVNQLLFNLYDRLPTLVETTCDGLEKAELVAQPAGGGNTIGWLLWHLTRVQDHHVSELLDEPQVWEDDEWGERFGIESDPANTGFGHDPEQMAAVRPRSSEAIVAYLSAVWGRTRPLLDSLDEDRLAEVIDDQWDPPVTLGVRLISVADDSLQHVGQAAYLRGLLERIES